MVTIAPIGHPIGCPRTPALIAVECDKVESHIVNRIMTCICVEDNEIQMMILALGETGSNAFVCRECYPMKDYELADDLADRTS